MDPVAYGLAGASFGALLVALWWIGRVHDRADRVDRKLDALLERSGVDIVEVAKSKATEYLQRGAKIEAIKVYRQLTGVNLSEAKAAVETIEQSA